MNRKIPFHELAAMLAANCNISAEEAEDFIRNFFDLAAQTLGEGDPVRIKGIGSFETANDSDCPVIFIPDDSIADTINAPFALFEPEDLSDTITEETLAEISDEGRTPAETDETETVAEETGCITEAAPECTPEAESESEYMAEAEGKIEEKVEYTPDTAEAPACSEAEAEDIATDSNSPSVPPVASVHSVPPAESVTSVPPAASVHSDLPSASATPTAEPETAPTVPDTITPGAAEPAVIKPASPSFPEDEPEEYIEEPVRHKSGGGFGLGFLIGLLAGLAIGACAVYFAIDYIMPTSPAVIEEPATEEIATEEEVNAVLSEAEAVLSGDTVIAAAPIVPAEQAQMIAALNKQAAQSSSEAAPQKDDATGNEKPAVQSQNKTVKDKVRPGYLLHDMAKKHYGNKCFWVYIYEENRSKISNPNRVSPGLELTIPAAEKYGINASSQASINTANVKASKILAKYPR